MKRREFIAGSIVARTASVLASASTLDNTTATVERDLFEMNFAPNLVSSFKRAWKSFSPAMAELGVVCEGAALDFDYETASVRMNDDEVELSGARTRLVQMKTQVMEDMPR